MTPPSVGSGRRVLVTGAGGFIGRHLVAEQLELGREVVALDLQLDAVADLAATTSLELVEGNITDGALQERALRGVDTVFHLAAAHLSVASSPTVYGEVNVEALKGLAWRSRATGVRRFVHCSTVGVFGALETLPADENTVCRPEFAYERTKLAGEGVLLAAHREHGLPVTILRPAWVYGPGCPRTERLFRSIRKGRFVVAGDGGSFRHSVYIRDMTDAFERAAHADAAIGEVIIVADDEAVTIRRLVDEIASITGTAPPRSVPYWLLLSAGWTAERLFGLVSKEPPLSTRSLRFFSGNTSFDTGRAHRLLGFEPEYGIHRGLRETFDILEQGRFWDVPLPVAGVVEGGR
ncbi:MAG TPA: NAD-dependent epimerase/dehydratase family protein [Longimicrobiales bacterium]|nr:NAD-dependent epimerase/dehydratase family protein [Longimicrobiales bacterium]